MRVLLGKGTRSAGAEAAIGDALQLQVNAWRGGQMPVYRDDRVVVLQCPGPSGCSARDGALLAELLLTSPRHVPCRGAKAHICVAAERLAGR